MIVKKYGGSALETPKRIQAVAEEIKAHLLKTPEPMIIVVSAMGDTTDQLLKMGRDLYQQASARELDMLISAGERMSMAMMTIALQKVGLPAISFTGSQAGIMTSHTHGYAFIKDIKPIRVDEELKKNKIVVIAGFQGVDPITKEVTTLGRGGTDTTAVGFAAHYKARQCELYKDVDGLLTAPPNLTSSGRLISEVDYDTLLSICYWGCKVVQSRAVELAQKYNLPLALGSWKTNKIGTLVKSLA